MPAETSKFESIHILRRFFPLTFYERESDLLAYEIGILGKADWNFTVDRKIANSKAGQFSLSVSYRPGSVLKIVLDGQQTTWWVTVPAAKPDDVRSRPGTQQGKTTTLPCCPLTSTCVLWLELVHMHSKMTLFLRAFACSFYAWGYFEYGSICILHAYNTSRRQKRISAPLGLELNVGSLKEHLASPNKCNFFKPEKWLSRWPEPGSQHHLSALHGL